MRASALAWAVALLLASMAWGARIADDEAKRLGALIMKDNSCYKLTSGDWEYSLCHGKHLNQVSHKREANLGMWLPGGLNPSSKYDEFTEGPELVLWMTEGHQCRGGKQKTRLRYVCGMKSKVVRFEELNSCDYHITVGHPALCVPYNSFHTDAAVQALQLDGSCVDFFDGEYSMMVCNGKGVKRWPTYDIGYWTPVEPTLGYEGDYPTLTYLLKNGSSIKCNGANRQAHVTYVCQPSLGSSASTQLLEVKESPACTYYVKVHTGVLCVRS